MQTLFGAPIESVTLTMLILVGLLAVILTGLSLRNRILVRLSLRNIPRRRVQSVLIVLGLTLSTVVIAAALVTGDTMSYSIRSQATQVLGQIDAIIRPVASANGPTTFEQTRFESLREQIKGQSELDGFVPALNRPVSFINPHSNLGDSRSYLLAVSPEYDQQLNGFKTTGGSRAMVGELAANEVYITKSAAAKADLKPGDSLQVFVKPGQPVEVRVKLIIEEEGLPSAGSTVVMGLDRGQQLYQAQGKLDAILVSNRGGMLDSQTDSWVVTERLRDLVVRPDIAGQIVATLRTSPVRTAFDSAAKTIPDNQTRFKIIVADLGQELDRPGVSSRLNSLIADPELGAWLAALKDLPAETAATLSSQFRSLSDLTVNEVKAQQLALADTNGGQFIQVFFTLGMFSVLTSALLIFLVFTMLASERKSEMGIARAIGLRRHHLVHMFALEGAVYDLAASLVGVLAGAGVAYLMVNIITQVFNATSGVSSDYAFRIQFYASPASLVIAYCLGLLLTFAVVTFSAWRVSRLNVIQAIQNLSENLQPRKKSWLGRVWRFIQGPILLQFGISAIASGYQNEQKVFVTAGVSVSLIGAGLFLRWLLSLTSLQLALRERLVFSLTGLGLIVFWAFPGFWNEALGLTRLKDGLEGFVISGVMLVLGAIWTLVYNADLLLKAFNGFFSRFGNMAPVIKTAIAYPLNAKFRTGMTLAMFALVIFTLIVMLLVTDANDQFYAQQNTYSGGFDIQATLSSGQSSAPDLSGQTSEGVQLVSGVNFLPVQIRQQGASKLAWTNSQLIGYDQPYLQQVAPYYSFMLRGTGFKDDAQIWQALRDRDDVAVVGQRNIGATSLSATDITLEGQFQPGQPLPPTRLEIRDPRTGQSRILQVIGVFQASWVGDTTSGIQVSARVLNSVAGQPVTPGRYFLKTAPGTDITALNRRLGQQYLATGIEFKALAPLIASIRSGNLALNQLFQGFLALGLLVGIIAIGVISGRMVTERRQQIGILRAIGYKSGMVQFSFLLEISFIALCGIAIGTGLGLSLGWNYVQDFARQHPGIQFNPPWLVIGGLAGLTYLCALLATLLPARQASRIYPSEALRYE